jgi:hypothetical protein
MLLTLVYTFMPKSNHVNHDCLNRTLLRWWQCLWTYFSIRDGTQVNSDVWNNRSHSAHSHASSQDGVSRQNHFSFRGHQTVRPLAWGGVSTKLLPVELSQKQGKRNPSPPIMMTSDREFGNVFKRLLKKCHNELCHPYHRECRSVLTDTLVTHKVSNSVLVNYQLDAQFSFRIYLFQFSTCFEHHCAHHQENQLY